MVVTLQAYQAVLEELRAAKMALAEKAAVLEARDAELKETKGELAIARLAKAEAEARVQALLRQLYGKKSEKLDPQQYLMMIEGLEQPIPIPPAAAKSGKKRKPGGGGRSVLPSHLTEEKVVIDLPEKEKEGLVKIREEVTEHYEFQPGKVILRKYVRYVYAHPEKEHAPVVAALPPEAKVIPQANVGPGLLAHIAVSKFADHLPLYRQEKMFGRMGVVLPRQKMGRWLESGALLLVSIVNQLGAMAFSAPYLQFDETHYNTIDPAVKKQVKKAFLWVCHSPQPKVVVVHFDKSHGHEVMIDFLPESWAGKLQTDGLAAYKTLLRKRTGIVHYACMAHMRRKWIEAVDGGSDTVKDILLEIGELYRIEREAREKGMSPDGRALLRLRRSVPLLTSLKAKIEEAQRVNRPTSNIGKAANYALERWPELIRFAEPGNGEVEIDNNLCENTIRPLVITRKNSLFIGNPDAGWVTAAYFTIIGTCKLLGVNPEAYLNWVFPKLAVATNQAAATGLLPHDYAALPVKEPA